MNLTTRILENLQLPRKRQAGDSALSAPAPQPGQSAPLPFIDQVNLVHTALFGWPCDHLTPLDEYLACENIRQVALKMLDSPRFRWDIREKIGLWPHEKWVMADYRGLQIWVNLFDGFVSFGVLHGNWENAEVDFMLSWLREGDGVIDAGANIGVFTIQAARAVGETGRVYAFEPMRNTYDMLARSVRANGFDGRCVLYNEGLGASEGEGSFHLNAHATNPGSSYISTGEKGERIHIRPLDSVDYERRIRFLKMDVEGFEPHIIRGAARTLAEHAPVILTEFFPRSLREIGGISGPGYVAMLEKLGYAMTVFTTDGTAGEKVTSADAHRFDDIDAPINLVCLPPNA
ncbi:FkbM family methyltransferase [Massilia consociata]|uniref:FkbM family methyltransferase n=1 Tax=Massilia consociata TaxID=760117 RepID=A0ABV6FGP3_9BURK